MVEWVLFGKRLSSQRVDGCHVLFEDFFVLCVCLGG